MEALCGIFEAVMFFGEVMPRSDEKTQELVSLIAAMESISASVKTFSLNLVPEEREQAFHSNKVFPELLKQVKLCEEVINRRYDAIETASGQASSQISRLSSSSRSGVLGGIRNMTRETMEVLGSKFGAFGHLIHLPEDELAVIRSASTELLKLVPLLNLAITAHAATGFKRSCLSESSLFDGEQKRPRIALQDASMAANSSSESRERSPEKEQPKYLLQLVSSSPVAKSCELPALTASDLRPALDSSSTTSLETSCGSDSGATLCTTARKLFGRQELTKRVPRQFTLPVQHGSGPIERQHVSRFVSRDHFLLEERPPPPSPMRVIQESLEAPTLEFGADNVAFGDSGDTLQMGGAPLEVMPLALATAKGLCKTGLHCRGVGQTLWRWIAQDIETELHAGDCMALLLESPPGSMTPGPARDLEAHEVTCLLGVEFRLPKQTIMSS